MKRLFLIFTLFVPTMLFAQYGPGPADKGIMFYKVKQYDKALGQFNEEIEANAEADVKTWLYRGLTQIKLRQFEEALSDFNVVLGKEPKNSDALLNRGISRYNLKDKSGAVGDFKQVLAISDTGKLVIRANYHLGLISYRDMDIETAVEYFSEVLKADPQFYDAYLYRGASNDVLLNFEASIEDYSEAIKLNPENSEAYLNRGMAKINVLTGAGNLTPSKKEAESACDDFRKALSLGDRTVEGAIEVYCK